MIAVELKVRPLDRIGCCPLIWFERYDKRVPCVVGLFSNIADGVAGNLWKSVDLLVSNLPLPALVASTDFRLLLHSGSYER